MITSHMVQLGLQVTRQCSANDIWGEGGLTKSTQHPELCYHSVTGTSTRTTTITIIISSSSSTAIMVGLDLEAPLGIQPP